MEGSAKGVSSKAEIARASRGLGREPSSEAEFAPRLARPRKGRFLVLGFPNLKRTWAKCLRYSGVFWPIIRVLPIMVPDIAAH